MLGIGLPSEAVPDPFAFVLLFAVALAAWLSARALKRTTDDLRALNDELDQRVTIMTLDGEVVSQWGNERGSEAPGEFLACPHGIWSDSRGDLYVGEVQADGQLHKYVRQG